jgi:hypothetical protein
MGRVLTNNTSFRYAIEGTETAGSRAIGFLPGEDPGDGGGAIAGAPVWKDIEPNDISEFGASIETVARNPIRRARGRQKGTISNLESSVGFEADITVDSFLDFVEGFLFSNFSNDDLVFRGANAETTGDTYTISAIDATTAAKIQSDLNIDTIFFASGYRLAANNGLKVVDTAGVNGATTIAVEDNLADETAPSNARLEIAGARFADGEITSFNVAAAVAGVSGRIGTITFGNVNPTTLGLQVSQVVFLELDSTIRGFARITSITASTIVLDKMDAALVTNTPSGATTRLLFGQFVRDVATDNAEFIERSFQFEAQYPGLAADGISDAYEYAKGNFCSVLGYSLDLNDKGIYTAEFIGTDTDVPTETRKVVAAVNPANALAPLGTEAFSTVADFARLGITDIDEEGLTTDIKNVEMTIDNNVSPENVLNRLGARFINFGNFFVDLTISIVFADADVVSRIRQNTTVSLDMYLRNNDGVLAFGVPSMTLGDGSKDLPTDETVLLNLTGEAFEDPVTGASLAVSFIPSVPT